MAQIQQNTPEGYVQALVLDAHPLITQSYDSMASFAQKFYVCPSVYQEIKDENARKNLLLWKDHLTVRQPKGEYIERVREFAKLTGDYSVLSAQDVHIVALALELDIELNGSDEHIRRRPGQTLGREEVKEEKKEPGKEVNREEVKSEEVKREEVKEEGKKKKKRRGGKKQREKREKMERVQEKEENVQEAVQEKTEEEAEENFEEKEKERKEIIEEKVEEKEENKEEKVEDIEEKEEYDNDEDDGDDNDEGWITQDNLFESVQKDTEHYEETQLTSKTALSSQDFAVQNVAIQLNLKLMNPSSGLEIKKIRTYMLRCHACFKLQKNSDIKHFCDYCGGATLLRCVVVVDSKTGELKPLLKKNFEWHNKGNKYSLPSPLSKNTQKRKGKGGFQHNRQSKNYMVYNDVPILRADQKEYTKALKNEKWAQRQNEKMLESWVGGGSADNFYTPFANGESGTRYQNSVRIGKGRHANASHK